MLGVNPTRYKVIAWGDQRGDGRLGRRRGSRPRTGSSIRPPPSVSTTTCFRSSWSFSAAWERWPGRSSALILTAINESLWSHFPQIHTLFFGAVIVIVVVFLPRGILWLFNTRGGWKGVVASLGAYRV